MKNIILMKSEQNVNDVLKQLQLDFELFESVALFIKRYDQIYETVDKIIVSDTVISAFDNTYQVLDSFKTLLDNNMLKYKKLYFVVSNVQLKEDIVSGIEYLFPDIDENNKEFLKTFSKSLSAQQLGAIILEKEDIDVQIKNTYEEVILMFKSVDDTVLQHKQVRASDMNVEVLQTTNYKAVQDFNSRRKLLGQTSDDLFRTTNVLPQNQYEEDILCLIPERRGSSYNRDKVKNVAVIGTSTSGKTTLIKYLLSSLTMADKEVMCYDLTRHGCLEGVTSLCGTDINYVNINEMENNQTLFLEHIQDVNNYLVSIVVGESDYVQEYFNIISSTEIVVPDFNFQVADLETADKVILSKIDIILVPVIPTKKHLLRTIRLIAEKCLDIRNITIKIIPSGVFGDYPEIRGIEEKEILPLLTKEFKRTNYIKNNVKVLIGETVYIPNPENSEYYLAEDLLDTKLYPEPEQSSELEEEVN